MADPGLARLHATVRGDVQGVGFRYFVLRRAWAGGLDGWVRNLPDGGVECVAQGPRAALEELLAALRAGPAAAGVARVDADWQRPGPDLSGFEVRD